MPNAPGLQADYAPMNLDPMYPYVTYHYSFASLGRSVLNSLDVGFRTFAPGVVNPMGIKVLTVPHTVNLLSAGVAADADILDSPPALNWHF